MRSITSGAGRLLVVLLVGAVGLLGPAAPASAHSADAGSATNYQTTITESPDIDGLDVRIVDAGTTIELRNATGTEVVVLGYADEPYLRLTPEGVWENERSPATWLNRTVQGDTVIPETTDPKADPVWTRVSDQPVARWHDHRAHWMGMVDPPTVQAAPGERHLVIPDWTIPLVVDGQPAQVVGDVTWVPGPSPWPWIASIAVVAIGLAALGLTRWWVVVATAAGSTAVLVALADGALAHLRSPLSPPAWWTAGLGLGILLVVVGVLRLRRAPRLGVALVGAGGLVIGGVAGLVDWSFLVRSQLPSEADPWLVRLLVVASLALGLGLAGLALARWSRPAPAPDSATVRSEAVRSDADGAPGAGPATGDPAPVGLATPDR